MDAMEDIGKEIAARRKAQRLRQADLASRAGVSRATLEALENGRAAEIGYSKLARILSALGLELRLGPAGTRRPTLDELLSERAAND
jgi:transcriptional regulator with XRE-family HTH domain